MFNNTIFFGYLKNNDTDGAMKYAEENVPDYLYKFYSLTDDKDELNQRKFATLKENSNWFDLACKQNDPLDMKMAYIDETNTEAGKESINLAKEMMRSLIDSSAICSFIDSNEENLQMWAHYANNHHGFCIKYKVDNKKAFFRVMYENDRIPVLSIPLNLCHEMTKATKEHSETEALKMYRYLVLLLLNIKHSSWSNEQEYRLISPVDNHFGINLSNELIGIKPVGVYLGLKCSDTNKNTLKSIAENYLNCECYEAFISNSKILDFRSFDNAKTDLTSKD